MKLPLTDQFLLDIYTFLEKVGDTYRSLVPRTMKEVLYPELFKMRKEYARKRDRRQFGQFLHYLKKKGYIQIKKLEHKRGVLLTPQGVARALEVKRVLKGKQKRPDGKWQMIIFDIPEKRRGARDSFRIALIDLGYEKLQESVWVSPYDVAEETEKVTRDHNLDSYIRTFLIEEISV